MRALKIMLITFSLIAFAFIIAFICTAGNDGYDNALLCIIATAIIAGIVYLTLIVYLLIVIAVKLNNNGNNDNKK